jgi:hypothetical protein
VIMSLVATVIAERVDARTGWRLFFPLLLFGAASIAHWAATGDLRLYAVVQFGAILTIPLAIYLFDRAYTRTGAYLAALGFYAAAKVGEEWDRAIFAATGGAVSGHTLKHVLAGAAMASILVMASTRTRIAKPAQVSDSGRNRETGNG